jgi:primosomal replication protein N
MNLMDTSNQVVISGKVVKQYPLKYTLNGIPVVSFVLMHSSYQLEAEESREVKCRLYCIIINKPQTVTSLDLDGQVIRLHGFLSQNAKAQLVLHVTQLELLDEGI